MNIYNLMCQLATKNCISINLLQAFTVEQRETLRFNCKYLMKS